MTRLIAAAVTDPGLERDSNEDSAFAQVATGPAGEPVGLFIVCDGMGGHLGGECASFWAVETVKHELAGLLEPQEPAAPSLYSALEMEQHIRRAVQRANQVVYDYASRHPEEAAGAGATLSMALVMGRQVVIANVGDSRTYLLRASTLRQITQDHSLVATLVAAGQIRPEEVFSHPQRNIIYRSLGQNEEVPVDIFLETLREGDALLLCSDGLWEMVREAALITRLIEKTVEPRQACEALVSAANLAGGEDNIGVVVVKVTE